MNTAHHTDGRQVSLEEWNCMQMTLVARWDEYVHEENQKKGEAVIAWGDLFAALAAKVCQQNGVSLEEFQRVMAEFQNSLVGDIDRLKYFLSQRAGEDVGLRGTVEHVRTEAIKVLDPETKKPISVQIQVRFPYLEQDGVLRHDVASVRTEDLPLPAETSDLPISTTVSV